MWICINMQKISPFYWFVLEIWLVKKSSNLIGWEHFGPYLMHQNFPKCEICAGTQQITQISIIEQILAHFWSISPFFCAKKIFLENPAVTHNFIGVSNAMPKLRKNKWCISKKTPGQMEGEKNGRLERPYFIGSFRLPPGVQKETL